MPLENIRSNDIFGNRGEMFRDDSFLPTFLELVSRKFIRRLKFLGKR